MALWKFFYCCSWTLMWQWCAWLFTLALLSACQKKESQLKRVTERVKSALNQYAIHNTYIHITHKQRTLALCSERNFAYSASVNKRQQHHHSQFASTIYNGYLLASEGEFYWFSATLLLLLLFVRALCSAFHFMCMLYMLFSQFRISDSVFCCWLLLLLLLFIIQHLCTEFH